VQLPGEEAKGEEVEVREEGKEGEVSKPIHRLKDQCPFLGYPYDKQSLILPQ